MGFARTPTGFIPQQDKGYLLVNVQLPDASSLERTEAVMRRLEEIALETEGVHHTVALTGQSILLGANEYPVPDVIGAVLRRVAGEATRVAGGPPASAVLTYPATWAAQRCWCSSRCWSSSTS